MKKKLLALSLPLGVLIYFVVMLVNHFGFNIPDVILNPAFIISIILEMIGLVYNGYCLGKRKNPYDFK